MSASEQPLIEAVNFMSDCCRLRTWQILNQQAFNSISEPRLAIETSQAGNNFTIYYWPDSHVLTFDALFEDAASVSDDSDAKAPGSALAGSETEARPKLPPPHIVLISHNQGISRVQIKHKPSLVDERGKALQLTLNKEDVSLEQLVQQAITSHAKCRLRVLHRSLQAKTGSLAAAGITTKLAPESNELEILVDAHKRLSVTVDTRSGDFAVRDVVRVAHAHAHIRARACCVCHIMAGVLRRCMCDLACV